MSWKSVAVHIDNIDIGRTLCDALFDYLDAFIDQGIDQAIDNLTCIDFAPFDTKRFRCAFYDRFRDVIEGVSTRVGVVGIEAGT